MGEWWEKRAGSVVVGAALFGALFAESHDAHAFCRTKACASEPTISDIIDGFPPCIPDSHLCNLLGVDLRWPTNCLSFSIQSDGSASSEIDAATATAVLEAAFETWAGADCGNGNRPSLTIVNHGEVACSRPEYNQTQPNANIIMFRDRDWPYKNVGDALALTTVTYNTETGVIYDADIEFNTHRARFTTDDETPPIIADLASIATHEIGHFLGLSHSYVNGQTTMREYYDSTTSFRTLDQDDVAGICTLYPPGQPLSDKCEPRHGFSGRCATPEKKKEGCALGAPRGGGSTLVLALSLGVLFAARRARRGGVQPGA